MPDSPNPKTSLSISSKSPVKTGRSALRPSKTTSMTRIQHPLELLAPAKNADFGFEAIKHGADAVYIGGPAFGARYGAGNDVAEIKRLCDFAHRYRAKVFVALNTILRDDELENSRQLAWQLYEAGADALIIQDMGLLEMDLPPIQLHASTQTDNRNSEKVKFLEDAGFSQVVLARECNLTEIIKIASQSTVSLEYFVHGALCVAYSGQCYISEAHTGRSANRGECAGVCSFKIEGRLKDLSYVKNITAHYRRLLDEIIAEHPEFTRASSGRSTYTFPPQPDKTFNRGYTDYFAGGRQDDIGAFDSPAFVGELIGEVAEIGDSWLVVNTDQTFHNGKGVCFYDAHGEVAGMRINRAEGNKLFPAEMPEDPTEGATLFRNRDQEFERALEKESAERRIAVKPVLLETADGLELTLTDEDGVNATVSRKFGPKSEWQLAQNPDAAMAKLKENLGKFGNTMFVAEPVELKLTQPWLLPGSAINALRREAAEQLQAARVASHPRPPRAAPAE